MLFGIIMRLIGASTATVITYTLLGGAAGDAFAVLALMFLAVWPQEWVIDKIGNLHGRRQRLAKSGTKSGQYMASGGNAILTILGLNDWEEEEIYVDIE